MPLSLSVPLVLAEALIAGVRCQATMQHGARELGGEAVIQEDTCLSLLLWFDNLQSTRTATEADAVTEGQ